MGGRTAFLGWENCHFALNRGFVSIGESVDTCWSFRPEGPPIQRATEQSSKRDEVT